MWRLIYALVLAFAKANWPCPSTWPEQCFFMNTNVQGGDIVSCSETVTADCWDCPFCPSLFRNEFGTYYDLENSLSGECFPPQCSDSITTHCWDSQPSHMIPFLSTTANTCDLFQFDCAKGYYYSPNGRCVACKPRIEAYECEASFYPTRCPRTMDMADRDGLCDECTFPALPTDTVGGATVYRYGVGILYPDCFQVSKEQNGNINMTTCANFQTPKWTQGWCVIECATGFVTLTAARAGVIGDLPKCRRCETVCSPGTYPPTCHGGAQIGDGTCISCPDPLPAHAIWVHHCEWRPQNGYYTDGSGVCLSCIAQTCENENHIFMGCHDSSPGSCRPCEISCASSKHFIHSDIQMDQCVCVPCTVATSTTYYSRNCSANGDAHISPCGSRCEPGFYISKGCSLYADLQCKPCTPVPDGRLLLSPCTMEHDVDHGPCPAGYACDGSSTPFRCPADRVLTVAGTCGCLPAMSGPLCLPISCPSGYYPDPISKGCLSCTQSDSVAALTLPNVMGIAACICPPSYFIRPAAPRRIHCWPAGDLGCNPRVQRQTITSGMSSEEPTCTCGIGPGMQANPVSLIPSELCSASCLPNYTSTAMVSPALRDDFGFLLLLGTTNMPLVADHRAFAVLGPELLLFLGNDGNLWVLTPMATVPFPVVNVFLTNFRLGDLRIHTILAHEIEQGYAWVLLSFWGYCAGHDDQGLCWAVQLIGLQHSSTPTLSTCIPDLKLCVTLKKGIDFEPSATAIHTMATGTDSLLVVWNDTGVSRFPWSMQPSSLLFSEQAIQVAETVHGFYILRKDGVLQHSNGMLLSYAPSSLSDVVAFPPGGHILMLQETDKSWVQVDLWNRFVSTPLAAAAFQRQTLVLANGTTISATVCGIDSYSPRPHECERLPCTFSLEACGPHSMRPLGHSSCGCQPGYYWEQDACLRCTDSLYYCPGMTAPIPCPAPSLSAGLRATLADCLCPTRWYHFESICLPCPVGFYCPSPGTLFPIPCHAGGHTADEGSSSPLLCFCPARTHSLSCEPCADSDDCAGAPVTRLVMVLESLNDELMLPCVDPVSVFYPGLVVTSNVSVDCLVDNGISLQILATTTLNVQEATPYGSRLEWDGKTTGSTCIAGYELLTITHAFGAQAHCFPCLNGTVRPKRSPSSLCAPCLDPYAHAPYMAMSECICIDGYVFDEMSNACAPIDTKPLYAPWWADTTVAISLPSVAAALGLIALLYHIYG